jgi:aminoglycoside phosphotransferase (APT) family kinase protein
MSTPGQGSGIEIAERLLTHLREETGLPGLDYAEPPRPVGGGYDTQIFGFRLTGAPAELSTPLILRLYAADDDPVRARWESLVQLTVVSLGYSAPRVLAECLESDRLGGAFIIMERLPGSPTLGASTPGQLLARIPWLLSKLPAILAQEQARLHSLDAQVLTQALEAAGMSAHGVPTAGATRDQPLDRIGERIESLNLAGLQSGFQWLVENHPSEPEEKVICHGDFHPLNVLIKDGRVSGVVDWSNTVVDDAALDVANTRVLLGLAPLEMPPVIDFLASRLRPLLIGRYTDAYSKVRSLDRDRLGYYEALRCLLELSWVSERRLAGTGSWRNPWGSPRETHRLISHFQRVTGVSVTPPPLS